MKNQKNFQDRSQNFWQLAAIQTAASGLPVIIVGGQIAKEYGAGTAILAVCIGNLILWVVGLAIILMAFGERRNAIENVKDYLGSFACIVGSLVLMTAFVSWYVLQIKSFMLAIGSYAKWKENSHLWWGVGIAAIIAFLAFWGIRLIKVLCEIVFPFLLCFVLYCLIAPSKYSMVFSGGWKISFFPIIAVIMVTLPGVVNLPTFFRHAHSKADAILGLSLMTVFIPIFQILSIVKGIGDPSEFFPRILSDESSGLMYLSALLFISVSLVCVNVVNIYFASAGWETISKMLQSTSSTWSPTSKNILKLILIPSGTKHDAGLGIACVFTGLVGAVAYRFWHTLSGIAFSENISDNILSTLGIVLLLAFLTKVFVRHRPRRWEKWISWGCWFFGCLLAISMEKRNFAAPGQTFALSMAGSCIAYMCAIFVEETYWSITQCVQDKRPKGASLIGSVIKARLLAIRRYFFGRK